MTCQCCSKNVTDEDEMVVAKNGKILYVFCNMDCAQDFANNEGEVPNDA